MSVSRPLRPVEREAIRAIFLRREVEYTTQEVTSLLRVSLGEVLALIEQGTFAADVKRKRGQLGGLRRSLITWNELASAAMLRWTVMEIHDALGEKANTVLPRLLRPVAVSNLRLPEYQVRLLESLAQRDGVSVEAYLFNALLDLEVAGDREQIEELLPGFTEAMAFPNV